LRRNCLLQQVIEGKIKVTGRWRRCRKLLVDLKERRGYSHLKEEALDRTMWRARFGPVVRQSTEWMNEWMNLVLVVWIFNFMIQILVVVECIFRSRCCTVLRRGYSMHRFFKKPLGNWALGTLNRIWEHTPSMCSGVCSCSKPWHDDLSCSTWFIYSLILEYILKVSHHTLCGMKRGLFAVTLWDMTIS
jgi:hypothetical protein